MLYSKTKLSLFSALIAASIVPVTSAYAQRVEPMRFELEPAGNGAQETLTVTNTKSFPITVEVVPSVLSIDQNGDETLAPADDDFLIFPPQAVIEPGRTQSIRVRYIGDPALEKSKAYRIGVNQLPIDMREDGDNGLSVTVNFATLVNVVPGNTRSDLTVNEVSDAGDGKWRVLVSNKGTRYARMPDLNLRFAQDGKTSDVLSGSTQGWFSESIILPGADIYLTLPAQEGFDPQRTSITLVDPS